MSQPSRRVGPDPKKPGHDGLANAIAKLSSSDHKKVYQGLVELRTKYVKQSDGISRIRQHGGLERVLRVLRSPNHKNMDVALSILGNCCMEDRTRTKILHLDAVEIIVGVLKNVSVESVRNRACRTLANLALDKQCCSAIHDNEEAIPSIVTTLKGTEDEDSRQTYTRALRVLADTPSHRMAVLECEGLKVVGELLKSDKGCGVPSLSSALKTLAHFLQENCGVESRRQLVGADCLTSVLTLTKHEDKQTRSTCRSLLLVMLKQEELRPPLGNAGCIEFLMETVLSEAFQPKDKYSYLNALCLCCHEVVNRVRIRDQGGLQLFLKLLSDKHFHLIHYRLVSALVCFLYDDQGFEILLQNNLVGILLKHLRKCSKIGEYKPTFDVELNAKEDVVVMPDLPSEAASPRDLFDDTIDASQDMFSTEDESEDSADETVQAADEGEEESEVQSHKPSLTLIMPTVGELEDKGKDEVADKDEERDSGNCTGSSSATNQSESNYKAEAKEENNSSTSKSEEEEEESFVKPSTSGVSITATVAECIIVGDATDSDSQGVSSDTETKNPTPKYSIDSPTYKEVSEWKMDSSPYHAGPTNIYESQRYYSYSACPSPAGRALGSPPCSLGSPPRTGPYSPMSVSSYLSSDWSPEGSPSRDASQTSCASWSQSPPSPPAPASAGLSPTPAALSEFDQAWDRHNRGEPAVGRSPAWSSAATSQNTSQNNSQNNSQSNSQSNSQAATHTGYHSPDSLSRAPSPPLNIGTTWWGDVTMPSDVMAEQYSSEEETEQDIDADTDTVESVRTALPSDISPQDPNRSPSQESQSDQLTQSSVTSSWTFSSVTSSQLMETSSSCFTHSTTTSPMTLSAGLELSLSPPQVVPTEPPSTESSMTSTTHASAAPLLTSDILLSSDTSQPMEAADNPGTDAAVTTEITPTTGDTSASLEASQSSSQASVTMVTSDPTVEAPREDDVITPPDPLVSTDPGARLGDRALPAPTITGDMSPPSKPASPASSSRRGQLPGKRKRHPSTPSTPETKQKILKLVHSGGSNQKNKALDIDKLISRLTTTKSDQQEEAKHDEVNIHKDPLKTTQHNILVLLSRVSYMANPSAHLLTPYVIDTLLDYVQKADKPLSRCSRILLRLSRNSHCMDAFIVRLIPILLEMRAEGAESESSIATVITQMLSQLALLCEGRFGLGVLEHLLLSGPESQKQRCALSLPVLCRSSSLKRRVFIKLCGLDMLLSCLTEDHYLPLAICSLHALTTHLSLSTPTLQQPIRDVRDFAATPVDNNVIFLLDDGTGIHANRERMISASAVFGAMLAGHYSESGQSQVKITNVNRRAFTCLVDYVHTNKYDVSDDVDKFDVLLELSALADKYSIPDLMLVVSNHILNDHMALATVAKIFMFSIMHNNEYLYKRSLFYMLTSNTHTDRVSKCFEPCLVENAEEVMKTLKDFLVQALEKC